jgi:hypothetical protein
MGTCLNHNWSNFMADMQITVPCTKCRKATLKMLSELETTNSVICPHCGNVENLTKQYWRDALANARKAANEFDANTSK